jgi:hypothetical protein
MDGREVVARGELFDCRETSLIRCNNSRSTMAKKILLIVIDAVLSFVFFIIAAIILDVIASKIFGTHQVNGEAVLNVNGAVMVIGTLVPTIAFAIWFYKFFSNRKVTKVEK